jgi:DNA primase
LGRIPDEIIQQVLDRVDIVDLIGRHLSLKKSGRNYLGLCPFHGEKTPSFNVNPDRKSFYCFGCQKGGSAFSFLMEMENLTFPEVVRMLARDCGVEIPEGDSPRPGDTEQLYRANEVAQSQYRAGLAAPGNPGFVYLEQRGFDADEIAQFEIGFVPDRWDTVANALAAEKIPAEIGARVGLLAERQSGNRPATGSNAHSGYYDRLRGRVTFPIRDVRGRIIGFGGRAIGKDQQPKYLNTPETPLFRKREALYGYPGALGAMRSEDRAVIVEGYFDQIALCRAGVNSAVATCGTALTADHARDLKRRTREVVLLFDGDSAGQNALAKALTVLLPQGLRVRAVTLPESDDPDTFLSREGPAALQALVVAAPEALNRVIERATARGHNTAWEKVDAVNEVAELLSLVGNAVERSEYVSRLALAVGTDVQSVNAAIRALRSGEDPREALPVVPRKVSAAEASTDRNLTNLTRSLIEYPGLLDRVPPDEMNALLPEGSAQEVIAALRTRTTSGAMDLEALCEGLSEPAANLVRRLTVTSDELDELRATQIFEDMLRWLRKQQRRQQSQAFKEQLRSAGQDWRPVLEKHQTIHQESLGQDRLGQDQLNQDLEPRARPNTADRTSERPMNS